MARLAALWDRLINPQAGKFWRRAFIRLQHAAGAGIGCLVLGVGLSGYVLGVALGPCGNLYPTTSCWRAVPWYYYVPLYVGLVILVGLAFWTVVNALYGLIMVGYVVRHVGRHIQAPTPPGTQY